MEHETRMNRQSQSISANGHRDYRVIPTRQNRHPRQPPGGRRQTENNSRIDLSTCHRVARRSQTGVIILPTVEESKGL